ncbi:MAG: hypothetical protein AAGE52_37575 [Myxococcota bacterium]
MAQKNFLWPDVSTETSAHAACKQAAYFAFFIAGITTLFAILSAAEVEFLQALGIDLWSLIDAALIGGLGFGVLKHSRVAAVLLLIVYAAERIFGMILAVEAGARPTSGLILTIFALAAFIGGVRGSFALARMRQESAPTNF